MISDKRNQSPGGAFSLNSYFVASEVSMIRGSWLSRVVFGSVLIVGQGRADDKPTVQSLDASGVKIAYAVQGHGEPVVLIHGWLASAAINWALPGTIALLAKDFQVIAMD